MGESELSGQQKEKKRRRRENTSTCGKTNAIITVTKRQAETLTLEQVVIRQLRPSIPQLLSLSLWSRC